VAGVQIAASAQLEFYDWEANTLTPNGKTVASQLLAQNPQALAISDGTGAAPGGAPGAGSMSLYDPSSSRQTSRERSARATRKGSQFYLFGSDGAPPAWRRRRPTT
jgi:hypothetical protein